MAYLRGRVHWVPVCDVAYAFYDTFIISGYHLHVGPFPTFRLFGMHIYVFNDGECRESEQSWIS